MEIFLSTHFILREILVMWWTQDIFFNLASARYESLPTISRPKSFEWISYMLANSLTPRSSGHPKKLTGPQLIRKFPAFYITRRLITAFTRARHLSLYCTRWIQSVSQTHFSKVRFNIILPSTLGFSKWSPSLRFSHQNRICTSPIPPTCCMPCLSQSSLFDHPNNVCHCYT